MDKIKSFMKILNAILLLLLALFTVMAFNSIIVFGHGLGDIIYTMAAGFSLLLMLLFFIIVVYKKLSNSHYIIAVSLFLILLSFCLKATVFRGPEYLWNGKIFYPTSVP